MMTMPTTPTSADPLVPPESSTTRVASPAIPTLEDLERLAPEERRVFRGVDWEFYERLHDVVGKRRWFRIAYDGRDLEIMPVGPVHEEGAWFGASLIEVIAEELEIPWRS